MPIYRATIVSFAAVSWTASVRLPGSQAQTLDSVKVSRGCPSADMTAGRTVLLDTGDHGDLNDIIIYAVVS